MNFGEKLTHLRKQKGLSQEELGEALNVTRQTISKWELGQTSPDTNKLTEIAKFFEIGVNELTNEEEIKFKNDQGNEGNKENKKSTASIILIIILVLLLFGVVVYATKVAIANSIIKNIFNKGDKLQNKVEQVITQNQGIINQAKDFINNNTENYNTNMIQLEETYNVKSFNSSLEIYSGTKYGSSVIVLLDKVTTNNKTNKEHIITVTYKETITTQENGIVEIKRLLDKFTEYEVSLDYDQNGYVNRITVKDI